MSDAARLYEQDFHAWTQDQAAALRAWPERLRPNMLDIAHVAEEIEDLCASQRSASKSLIRQSLIQLLKLKFHPDQSARSHWRKEVREFRARLDDTFGDSPSLRARRAELAEAVWDRAARDVCGDLEDDGHGSDAVAARLSAIGTPCFDLDREVLAPDWYPERTDAARP